MASKLTGNWKGIISLSNNLDKDLKRASKDYYSKQANLIKEDITNSILNQTENWAKLDSDTIEAKDSSEILLDTGILASSLAVTSVGDTDYVISPKGQHPSGLSNSELAIIHEFGTEEIAPRPFIQPTQKEFDSKVKQGMCEIVGKEIAKYK